MIMINYLLVPSSALCMCQAIGLHIYMHIVTISPKKNVLLWSRKKAYKLDATQVRNEWEISIIGELFFIYQQSCLNH